MSTQPQSEDPKSLLSLPPDVLLTVLLQTPAEAHDSLRKTSSELCKILDSNDFRIQRGKSEHAEVEVRTFGDPAPAELTDLERQQAMSDFWADLGYDPNEMAAVREEVGLGGLGGPHFQAPELPREIGATIYVDGKPAGNAKVNLIPRSPAQMRDFYREINQWDEGVPDLTGVAHDFCYRNGAPRLECIRNCGDQSAAFGAGGFAYIANFNLDKDYAESTYVGASALKQLLESPALRGQWVTAVYIADAIVHFNDKDKGNQERFNEIGRSEEDRRWGYGDPSEDVDGSRVSEEVQFKKDWKNRFNELGRYDGRQFLRAGFLQATELSGYRFYITPSQGERDSENFMSHKDAMDLPIKDSPVYPDPPFGVSEKLRLLISGSCRKRSKRSSEPESIEEEEESNTWEEENPNTQATAFTRISEIRTAVARLLALGATVEDSHALHVSAYHLDFECLQLLLDHSTHPDAINVLDSVGNTPLISAACSSAEGGGIARFQKMKKIIAFLLGRGADKDVVHGSGMTALGFFRGGCADPRGGGFTQFLEDEHGLLVIYGEIEQILKSTGGATTADNSVLEECFRDIRLSAMMGTDDDFDY